MPFEPGDNGGAKGRTRKYKQVVELFTPHIPAAAKAMIDALQGEDEKAKLTAAKDILDRVYGKAPQAVELSGSDGAPISVNIIKVIPK